MAIENHGSYITGTPTEISDWKNQQTANQIGTAVAAGTAVVAIAGVAAVVAALNAARQANSQIESYRQFYHALRPAFAKKILRRSIWSALLKTLIFSAFYVAFAIALYTTQGGAYFVIPIVIGIIGDFLVFGTFRMGYLSKGGMRVTHKVVCPHCHQRTPVIGYGMCRHCFGFLSEQNRQDVINMRSIPLPEVIGKAHITDMASALTDSYLTSEVKATSSLRWMAMIGSYGIMILSIPIGMIVSVVVSGFAPAIAGVIVCILSLIMRNVYKNSINQDTKRFCTSVASPKPVPVKAIINGNYDSNVAETGFSVRVKSTSYKPLAWTAFGFYVFACFFPALTQLSNSIGKPDAMIVLFSVFSALSLPTCIILGIIAIVKRKKYRTKLKEKAKFNIYLLLTIIAPIGALIIAAVLTRILHIQTQYIAIVGIFVGIAFAILSFFKKQYSDLSKHIALWIAASWIALLGIFLTQMLK